MRVVLVGYMASGKTSLGKVLANEMNLKFIDLDAYIEEKLHKSIPDIFLENGEIFFRKTENALLTEVLTNEEDIILATGGGTPCYGSNMDVINEKSDHSIYLQLSIEALVNRIKDEKEKRPLVKHLNTEDLPEFIGKHLFERRPFYLSAKHTVSGENKDLRTLASEIKSLLL